MTFYHRNPLCVDSRCFQTCAHRGPKGELCYFEVEQKLCDILNLTWIPSLDLDNLLSIVRDRLAQLPSEDDYNAQIKLAQRNLPIHPATLTAEEDEIPK